MEVGTKRKIEDYIHWCKKNHGDVPFDNESDLIQIINEGHCSSCHKNIYDLDSFAKVIEGYVICEDCEQEEYYTYCPICEEYFKTLEPEDHNFVISKEDYNHTGLEAGIYEATKDNSGYPYHNKIDRLIRSLDINSILDKLYYKGHGIQDGAICLECFDKYGKISYRYTKRIKSSPRDIYERGIINQGF